MGTFPLGWLIAGIPRVVDIFLGMAWSLPAHQHVYHSVEASTWEFTHQVVAKMLPGKNWTTTLSGFLFI